jgi:tetratricopeptide (TPR) repeat protein
MSTAVMTNRLEMSSVADGALKAAGVFWFVVTVIGQWIFVLYIVANYGTSAARGDYAAWNKTLAQGWQPGATLGNAALAAHLFFAAMISFSGALQLVPQIRAKFAWFHRWNGRFYIFAAFTMGISALFLIFSGRRIVGDTVQHIASGMNAGLILICAALALRYALLRDFRTHRVWALRLFLVVSGVWFFRVGLMLSLLIFKGPVGYDPATFTGPFVTFLGFAQFLLPLAVLEMYLRAKERPGAVRRMAVAVALFVLTLGMGAGIFGATLVMWTPRIKQAFDARKSVTQVLSATIAAGGADAAAKQYHDLKASAPSTYNFDEGELNDLGYQLIRSNQFKPAIRILQLNVEAYPQSSNAYDSLGEAYMDDGEKAQAIGNYEKSLQLNPKNGNAVKMLEKLKTP